MDWIGALWRDRCSGDRAFWRTGTFWLTAAVIILPFGWLFLALRLQPVRARASYFRRDS
jgi:hypothetical protein